MRPITINAFQGASTAVDDLLLPEGVGVASLNQQPGFADFRPWAAPGANLASVPASPQRRTIYRMGQGAASDSQYWLGWSGVVHATTGFDVDDTTERTYYTGDGSPKVTNNIIGLTGGPPYPQAARELAMPAPTTALVAAINAAGTGTPSARAYRYTWVNDWGWESAPSPSSNTLLVNPDGTVDLSGFDTPPAGNYGISIVRLYQVVVGETGTADWFFLREWAIGSTPANPIDDARGVGSDELATEGWRPPPANAKGLCKLWNGMFAIGSGNGVRISEPFIPYAYPLAYEVPLGAEFVAQAVVGQRLLVLTKADARIIAGSTPPLDDEPANINRPCASAQGVVSFNEGVSTRGVVWPSEDGLCWWGESTGYIGLTDKLLTRAQWQALNPSTMVAARYGRFYVCFYTQDGSIKGFVLDPSNPSGLYFLSTGYHAAFRDPVSDRLYVLDGANIKRWEAGAAMTATFRSKQIQLPAPINIGAIEVICKGYPVTVTMWADGVQRHTETLTSDRIIRPPGGWEADTLQFEVTSAQRVIAVRAAPSVDDLRSV